MTAGYAVREFVEQGLKPGELAILSAESKPPYERPPLSKAFLAGEQEAEDTLINELEFYEEHDVQLFLNTRVTEVNLDEGVLEAGDRKFSYENLLIATGSRPRTLDLSGAELDNIFYLRRLDDSRAIRQAAQGAKNAVILGGGFIGMEVASILQQQGVETTMIFPEEHVWGTFFTEEMADFFEEYYEDRGVTIMPETLPAEFRGRNGRVRAVITSDGEELPADLVVAGIGVVPNLELFENSPLEVEDGIVVNRFLQTSVENAFAAGDVARYHDVIFGKTRRVEHWDNAVATGQHAAQGMMGRREIFRHVPYFFSDVFDLSYEFWGDASEADEVVYRGDFEDASFSVWWLKEGRLQAAFVMNRPEEERQYAPEWIKEFAQVPAATLADEDQKLKRVVESVVQS